MRRFFVAVLCLITALSCSQRRQFDFSSTLRVDFNSTGDRYSERADFVSFTRLGPWSGPQNNLVDTADLGDYRIVVKNCGEETIFLKGYSTLFGEYRTTDRALTEADTYYNSINIPMPVGKCVILIECRDKRTLQFSTIGEFHFDPDSVGKCDLPPSDATDIIINGQPRVKVDLTFVAEGYTAQERDKFIADVKRFNAALFACPPFDRYASDFNVRAVMTCSDSSGVDHPHLGIYRNTPLNAEYYTFEMERYLTTRDMKSVADVVWDVPTDAIFILVNEPVYGGGGIYNFYAIGSSDNERTLSVFIHEFGHSFGALADEYFNKSTAYEETFYPLDVEPWEKNITTLVDFDSKWKSYRDSLFEGGGYRAEGIYRPAEHCMMRDYAPFCPVCTKSIIRNIDYICDRLANNAGIDK